MLRIIIYLIAFILSNLVVLNYGSYGLIFTSLFLIPFDFIMRCLFHESWSGLKLIRNMAGLIIASSVLTFLINSNSFNIALASCIGFLAAQITSGIFYQSLIKKSYFIKVNGSDFVAIITDSIIFQIIAFNSIDYFVTGGQIILKIVGGLFWYWILFKIIKIKIK